MVKKGQTSINLLLSLLIMIFGSIFVLLWAFGDALQIPNLSGIGRVGLALFLVLYEIIQAVIKGGFK
ncbi:hypothetical protein HY498_01835 [Candidatus Woesearchaeota archaeon]|nr:hypothetical protein [Candidatus Woesearchaeota archaeon]